jgi:hypothetical protein
MVPVQTVKPLSSRMRAAYGLTQAGKWSHLAATAGRCVAKPPTARRSRWEETRTGTQAKIPSSEIALKNFCSRVPLSGIAVPKRRAHRATYGPFECSIAYFPAPILFERERTAFRPLRSARAQGLPSWHCLSCLERLPLAAEAFQISNQGADVLRSELPLGH